MVKLHFGKYLLGYDELIWWKWL